MVAVSRCLDFSGFCEMMPTCRVCVWWGLGGGVELDASYRRCKGRGVGSIEAWHVHA